MKNRGQTPSRSVGGRSSGPQGTRLFAVEELRQYSGEAGAGSTGRASVHAPVLEGSSAGLVGRRFVLRTGRQTIGRRDDNDIVVSDPSVSASHAWIINQQGHCVIMNTLSTNGTFVNDKRIHETILKHGDRIRLGRTELVFLTREKDAPAPVHLLRIVIGLLVLIGLGAIAWWRI